MQRFYVLLLFILSIINLAHAQVDTDFWFAPPSISQGHGDRPLYIRVSSLDQGATIRVLQPARGNAELANFTIGANTTQTIDLTNQIDNLETSTADAVMKTGIRIQSSAPITAYYEEASTFNAEIFVLKGKNALGNRFIIPGQNTYDNSRDYAPTPNYSFDVVATQNSTVVTVKPTKPLVGHTKDTLITVKLNAGETYSFQKVTLLASDNPVGSIVESNKPIAITLKDDSDINGSCRDLIGDQMIPVKVAGMEYVVLKGFLSTSEFVFITATEDDTKIFISGSATPTTTLHTGQLYRYQLTTPSTYIVSNKVVYVIHVTGFGCELGMAVLPSITCKGSEQIAFTRSTSEFFGLNILVHKEGISHFLLNGSPSLISASQFTPVPGTNDSWYTAQLSFNTATIPVGQASTISNDLNSFQVGTINGDTQTTCRYGYFSSFATLFIGDDFNLCEGDVRILDAGAGKYSYVWSTGATTQTIDVKDAGQYFVKVEKDQCILYDTINVGVKKGVEDLGPDVAICPGEPSHIDGKENFSWLWSDGSTDRFLATTVLGKYWVSVIDDNGCTASDTIMVNQVVQHFDSGVAIRLNVVSIDTLKESNVMLRWTVTDSERTKRNRIFLYKRIAGAPMWEQLAIVPADNDSLVDANNATNEKIYEYYAGLAKPCGDPLLTSSVHNTILLTGEADTIKKIITLTWNSYQTWDDGVKRYELWRKLDDAPGYKFVAAVAGTENTFLSPSVTDGFEHHYIIRAIESSGESESWSNSVHFVFENNVFVPNVFTPQGDTFNQYFEITNIELYKNSRLTIVDRWGKVVFHATGYKSDWDGDGLVTGVYYYELDLRRKNKVLKGTVSILR